MLSDFKQFLLRGDVVDLAVGVVVGAAFGTVVSALVNDPTTKKCPECLSEIPSAARRCSYCTQVVA